MLSAGISPLGSVDFYCGPPGARVATEDVDVGVIDDRAGGDVAGDVGLCEPAEFSVGRVEAPDLAGDGEHDVGATFFRCHDEGRAVGQLERVALGLPFFCAVFQVEAEDGLRLFCGADDEGVIDDDRAGGRAPAFVAGAGAEIFVPEFLAVEIVGVDAALAEEGVNFSIVDDRSVGGVTVFAQEAAVWVFLLLVGDFLFPKLFASFAIDADQVADKFAGVGRLFANAAEAGDENFSVSDHRAGAAHAREIELPLHVFLSRPFEWDFVGADALPVVTAEACPIFGGRQCAGEGENKRGDQSEFHLFSRAQKSSVELVTDLKSTGRMCEKIRS